jgi:hypothetical protein
MHGSGRAAATRLALRPTQDTIDMTPGPESRHYGCPVGITTEPRLKTAATDPALWGRLPGAQKRADPEAVDVSTLVGEQLAGPDRQRAQRRQLHPNNKLPMRTHGPGGRGVDQALHGRCGPKSPAAASRITLSFVE